MGPACESLIETSCVVGLQRERCGNLPKAFTRSFWRARDWSARRAAVKYAMDAVNYLMDAAGYSLPTAIYYLSQALVTCNMRATFDILAQDWAPGNPQDNSDFALATNPEVFEERQRNSRWEVNVTPAKRRHTK